MKFLRYFFISLIAAGCASTARAEDCLLQQVASLTMDDGYKGGAVVVDVSIAGNARHFMLDTGGVFTSVDQHVADELNLRPHALGSNVEVYNVQGGQKKRYVNLPDLTIGTMKGDDIPVLVNPDPAISTGIDGILAPDILSKFDVELDFANRKVNLFSQEHCEGYVVYWSDTAANADFTLRGDHIVLSMTLDGQAITATLDTGSPDTHLSELAAHRLFDLDENSPGMEPIPGATPQAVDQRRYRFKLLSIGGLAVDNPMIYIARDRALDSFQRNHLAKEDIDPVTVPHLNTTDMILGMNVIGKLHLYIAYKEHKLYLTSAAAH